MEIDMAEDPLSELRAQVLKCTRCKDLVANRTTVVFGEGNPKARVMFVGEAPGRDEDIAGRPFVGAAGRVLTQMIREILGMEREDVFIANVLKCRPKDNRDPRPEEIENCREYIMAQIALIRPKVVCMLGRHSMETLMGPGLKISKVHGTALRWKGMIGMPVYHPAAALYKAPLMEDLKNDFRNLRKLLDEGAKGK